MNTSDERTIPALPDTAPAATPAREVVLSGPVYDGELVDEQPATPHRTIAHRFMNWWCRSRHVPAALKSRQAARQGGKDAVVWLVRCPFRFAGAVLRGLVVCVRAWRSPAVVRTDHRAGKRCWPVREPSPGRWTRKC
jgi:S-DNA-T family DNA segregation ATPase FtsK/SpoIIIE